MGISTYKTKFKCDCGENYGRCGVEAGFIMSYNRSCDLGTIHYYHGIGTKQERVEYMGTFTDDGLGALGRLLDMDEPTPLSPEERADMKRLNIPW